MNQPIPRSFFKDGQRAILRGMKGKIVVENGNGIAFLEDGQDELRVLMVKELMYLRDDLELLDRTIDQVVAGDYIEYRTSPTEASRMYVVARVDDAVFCNDIIETNQRKPAEWYELSTLDTLGWTIVQTNPEVMTDETAKALREEAMKKMYRLKYGEYFTWHYVQNRVQQAYWHANGIDIGRYYSGNIHATEEDAKYYGKYHAPAFLHVFKE